jgi:hypothetical protein
VLSISRIKILNALKCIDCGDNLLLSETYVLHSFVLAVAADNSLTNLSGQIIVSYVVPSAYLDGLMHRSLRSHLVNSQVVLMARLHTQKDVTFPGVII